MQTFKVGDVIRYVRPNSQNGGLTKNQIVTVVGVIDDMLVVDCSEWVFYHWRFEKVTKRFKGNIK